MLYFTIGALWYVIIFSYVTVFSGDDCEGDWCRVFACNVRMQKGCN